MPELASGTSPRPETCNDVASDTFHTNLHSFPIVASPLRWKVLITGGGILGFFVFFAGAEPVDDVADAPEAEPWLFEPVVAPAVISYLNFSKLNSIVPF